MFNQKNRCKHFTTQDKNIVNVGINNNERYKNTIPIYRSSAILIKINSLQGPVIIDTGAVRSCIAMKHLEEMSNFEFKNVAPEFSLISAGGNSLNVLGITELPVEIGGTILKVNFYVLQDLAPGVLIGMDFLNQYFAKLDFEKGKLQLKIGNLSIETKFLDGPFDRNRSYLVTRSFVKPK